MDCHFLMTFPFSQSESFFFQSGKVTVGTSQKQHQCETYILFKLLLLLLLAVGRQVSIVLLINALQSMDTCK